MAIVVPTEYVTWQGRDGEVNNYIVELTSRGTKWTIGTFETGNAWTDEHVYELVTKAPKIKQKIDPINHDPSRATVNLTLSNLAVYKDKTKIGEVLGDIVGQGAAIYHMNSPNATTTSDCLQIFSGSTQSISDYNEKTFKVRLEDSGYVFDKTLLNVKLKDSIPNFAGWEVRESTQYDKIPLIYGDYTMAGDDPNGLQTGLAKIVQGTKGDYHYVAATGNLSSGYQTGVRGLYIPVGQDLPAVKVSHFSHFTNITTTTDESGRSYRYQMWVTPVQDPDQGKFLAKKTFTLDTDLQWPYNVDRYNHTYLDSIGHRLPFQMGNNTIDAPARFERNGGYTTAYLDSQWTISSVMVTEINQADILQQFMTDSTIEGNLYLNYEDWHTENNIVLRTSANVQNPVTEYYAPRHFTYNVGIFNSVRADGGWVSPIYQKSVPYNGAWVHGTVSDPEHRAYRALVANTSENAGSTNHPWSLYLSMVADKVRGATDGVYPDIPADVVMGHIGYANLEMEYNLEVVLDTLGFSKNSYGLGADYAFVDVSGRLYWDAGSPYWDWVNNMFINGSYTLSSNQHVGGRGIIDESPCIIASLLCDELNVNPTDIDWDGFVDAVSYSIRSRYNVIDPETTLGDVIKDLCDQGMFTYAWTAAGKMKLIPLRGFASPTRQIKSTILYGDVDSKGFSVGKTDIDEVVNHITVKSKWFEDEQRFVDEDVYENTTSQLQYGIRKRELEFKNITVNDTTRLVTNPIKTVMVHLIEPDLVNGVTDTAHQLDDGFWANQRVEVSFSCPGSKHAHLDVGDWIRVDATSVDPHILMFNESWGGKEFMVTSMDKSEKGVKIIAEKITDVYTIFRLRGLEILQP